MRHLKFPGKLQEGERSQSDYMLHGKKIREEKENKQTNKLMVGLLKRSFGGEQRRLMGNSMLFLLGMQHKLLFCFHCEVFTVASLAHTVCV